MAFNRSPLRDITQEDIDTYQRDGVVTVDNIGSQHQGEFLGKCGRIVHPRCDLLAVFPKRPQDDPT